MFAPGQSRRSGAQYTTIIYNASTMFIRCHKLPCRSTVALRYLASRLTGNEQIVRVTSQVCSPSNVVHALFVLPESCERTHLLGARVFHWLITEHSV